jgi:hypothetical protein
VRKDEDISLILLELISASLRLVGNLGDVVYSDDGVSDVTKKKIDSLIIQLNLIFTEAIKKVDEQRE